MLLPFPLRLHRAYVGIFMSSMTGKMRGNLLSRRINWQIVLCTFARLLCIHADTARSQ